MALYVGM